MRDNARRMTEMHEKMGPAASMSAPEHLDRMEKMTAGMMGMAQSTKAAFMPLYSVMSPEQKKVADNLARLGLAGADRMGGIVKRPSERDEGCFAGPATARLPRGERDLT